MGIQECIIDVNRFSADSAITARQGVFVSITRSLLWETSNKAGAVTLK